MLKRRSVVLAGCLLFAAATLLLASSQEHAQTIIIAGRVVADATDQPVRRAVVVLHGAGTNITRVAATDLAGAFQFDDLPAGTYRIGASKRPYLGAVIAAAGTGVVIRLRMGAAAFGVVLNEALQPAPDVLVTLSGPSLSASRTATTDIRGEYRIHGLPAGEYRLETSRSAEPRNIALAFGEQLRVLPLELKAPTLVTSATTPAPLKPGTGTVGGLVLDVRTNLPLAGITVNLGRAGRRTVSDFDGRYRFLGLPAGSYTLTTQHPNYFSRSPATVPLGDGEQVSDVTLRMGRQGSISGAVRDDLGDPVVGVPVRTLHKMFLRFQPVIALAGSVVTDDRGYFRIDGLLPGEYLACACDTGPVPLESLLLTELGVVTPAAAPTFAPTYHPGRTRGADAQLVTVDYGDDRLGIDIVVQPAANVIVSGEVTEEGAAPSRRTNVLLFPEGDLAGSTPLIEPQPVAVSPTGAFRLVGVSPGEYLLAALPADGEPGLSAVVPIRVEDRDVSGLVLALKASPSVHGRLEFSGSSSGPDSETLSKTTIVLRPLEYSTLQLMSAEVVGSPGEENRPDANGRFAMPRVHAGAYKVSVTVPNSRWKTVESVRTAAGGLSPDAILTVGPTGADDLVITMSDGPLASLEGTTVLDRYESPNALRVVLFPSDRAMWTEASRFADRFPSTVLAVDRSFRLESLPAGEYFIVVVPGSDLEMSAQRLELWSRTAQRVRLRAGDRIRLEIKR